MRKGELIKNIIKTSEIEISEKKAKAFLNATFEVIIKTTKKEKRLAIPEFGIFRIIKRKARKGRNPKTNEVIKIKASEYFNFRSSKSVKDDLNSKKIAKKKK